MRRNHSVDAALRAAQRRLRFKPGDIYEDCAYHPVVCVGVDYRADEIWGVSLIDGTEPRTCSMLHCGVRKLTLEEALQIKRNGPPDDEARAAIPPDRRWWREPSSGSAAEAKVTFIAPARRPVKRKRGRSRK